MTLNRYWVQKLRIHFQGGQQDYSAVKDPSWQTNLCQSARCFLQTVSESTAPPANSAYGEKR